MKKFKLQTEEKVFDDIDEYTDTRPNPKLKEGGYLKDKEFLRLFKKDNLTYSYLQVDEKRNAEAQNAQEILIKKEEMLKEGHKVNKFMDVLKKAKLDLEPDKKKLEIPMHNLLCDIKTNIGRSIVDEKVDPLQNITDGSSKIKKSLSKNHQESIHKENK